MKFLLTCVLVAFVVIACRKKNQSVAPAPEPPAEQPLVKGDVPKVKNFPPVPTGTPKPSNLPPDVEFESSTAFRELSTGLQLFVSSKKRFPTDLEEIKAAGLLPNGIPTPPPGIRLVIDQKTKTVQAVR